METTVAAIAELVGGRILRGDPERRLTNFAALDQADDSCVAFLGNPRYREMAARTRAGLLLVEDEGFEAPLAASLVLVANPGVAFDVVLRAHGSPAPAFLPGVAPGAYLDPEAELDPNEVSVGPNASVLRGAKVGRGTRIGAGAVVAEGALVGEDCVIGPNATLCHGCILGDRVVLHAGAVVGADGFGFELVEGRHRKIEQLGIVRIGDDVEIGASTTIDRARFGETVVGEGTKIDNQVQIAHNCLIGKHCIIVAQTGISGSTRIGDYVVLAAQTGVAGHLTIADRVTCGGRSGVISSIDEPGGTYFGYPARPLKEDRREAMRIKQLGGLLRRVKALESRIFGSSGEGDETEG